MEPEGQLLRLEGPTVGVYPGSNQYTSLCHTYFMCSTLITSISSRGILICHISFRFSDTIYYTFCICMTLVESPSNLVQIFSTLLSVYVHNVNLSIAFHSVNLVLNNQSVQIIFKQNYIALS
jgi:hypothetical protein